MLASFARFLGGKPRVNVFVVLLPLVASSALGQAAASGDRPAGTAGKATSDPVRQIDPRAEQMLRKMCDYLGGLRSFSVQALNSLEVIRVDGEKLGFESVADVTVQRPRIRSHRIGVDEAELLYDGKALTVYSKKGNFYASEPAPPTLDAAIDLLRDSLSIDLPGGDLLYSDAYAGLMADVYKADYVGVETLAGVHAHHLAFRGREVDFQIWIEDGDKPLPRKYVITTKWMAGAPSFGISMTNWNVSPRIDDAAFVFTPPSGARQIEFVKAGASSGR